MKSRKKEVVKVSRGAKFDNLNYLQNLNQSGFCVPRVWGVDLLSAETEEVVQELDVQLQAIIQEASAKRFAVRSSSALEDSDKASFAGQFESILNVEASVEALREAIDQVYRQYQSASVQNYLTELGLNSSDYGFHIFVQEMVSEVEYGGVAFSTSLDRINGNYLSVNFDVGSTDSVTSGLACGRHLMVFKHVELDEDRSVGFTFLEDLRQMMLYLENHFGAAIDVEFCVKDSALCLLQVRPLVLNEEQLLIYNSGFEVADSLSVSLQTISIQAAKHPVLGDMIDINPRELVGENPSVFTADLYGYMFVDSVVADARRQLGYQHVSEPLAIKVANKPYVSLQRSGLSLLPDGLSDYRVESISDSYRAQLLEDLSLQSSVEFDVYQVSAQQAEKSDIEFFDVLEQGLQSQDLHQELMQEVRDLEDFISEIKSVSRIEFLLEKLQLATNLFTKVARLAFYFRHLNSLEYGESVLNQKLSQVVTVSSQFVNDQKTLSHAELLQKYGHLRPSQFDIFVPNYAATPDMLKPIQGLFDQEDLQPSNEVAFDQDPLIVFSQAREQVKFLFTHIIDRIAAVLMREVSQMNLEFELLKYLKISEVLDLLSGNLSDLGSLLEDRAQEHLLQTNIVYPEVVLDGNMFVFEKIMAHGTFVGSKVVEAPVVCLSREMVDVDLDGKIVLLEAADPGFDFIFASDIKGFVTKVGGPNSHMAIRAHELGLTACIGNTAQFDTLVLSTSIKIDPINNSIDHD